MQVRDKVNALKQKSDAFYHYAEQITNLLETAERIDQEVADAITAQREYFLDHHKSLRLDDWKAKLLGLLVDLKNSIPHLGTIADLLEGLNTVIESLGDSIRHWYECEGGKYVIGEIAAVAEACLAVAIFAATFPISTFTGFCLAVGFGIAALNSCVNVKTSYKAAEAAMDGNPALAEIYGKQDTLSDVLRQKNYGNGTMNDLSNFTAGALDVTEAVCITVGMAGQIVNLFKKSYNLLKYRKSLNYSSLQNNLESGSVKLENVIKEEYKNTKNIGLADDTGAVGELEKSADLIKGSGAGVKSSLKTTEVTPPGSSHPVKVYTDGNAQINTGKIDTYMRGKVELDVDAVKSRINELKNIKKTNTETFNKNMKSELKSCEDKLHNYQRSQEMSKTLNNAGILDNAENNQMIAEELLEAAKSAKTGNTEIISYIKGANGKIQVVSRWKILDDGTPYLATVILKPIK